LFKSVDVRKCCDKNRSTQVLCVSTKKEMVDERREIWLRWTCLLLIKSTAAD